jgi:hypothetical protein
MRRIIAISMFLLAACDASSGDGGTPGGKDPFGTPSAAAVSTLSATRPDGTTLLVTGARVGDITVGEKTYARIQLGDFTTNTPRGGELWGDWRPDAGTLTVAGGLVHWADNGIVAPGLPFVTANFDAPVTLDIAPPLGVAQALHVTGQARIGDAAETQAFDVEATYMRVADDAVAETSIGPIAGCSKFEGRADILGTPRVATLYYHPDFGFVAGSLDWPPPNGVRADFVGLSDPGVAANGTNVVKGAGVIDAAHRTFRLDTYAVHQAYDADKMVHAKMLLEVRWVDAAKASTSDFPALFAPDFGTVWGTFPSAFVASPVSLFHPSENGQGFTYWIAYVDQAAKNEPGGNGIAYHAGVTLPDFVSSAMRVSGRIVYRLVAPE